MIGINGIKGCVCDYYTVNVSSQIFLTFFFFFKPRNANY